MKGNPHIIHPSIGDRRDDRFLQADFTGRIPPSKPDSFRFADNPPSASLTPKVSYDPSLVRRLTGLPFETG